MLSRGVDEEASLNCVEAEERTPGLQFSTVLDVLQYRALAPSATRQDQAITFLRDGGYGAETITFKDLDLRARSVAAHIQLNASPGDRVLLVYPPGLDFIAGFLGCVYAGAVAVPLPAPSGDHPVENEFAVRRRRHVVGAANPNQRRTADVPPVAVQVMRNQRACRTNNNSSPK